MIGVALKGLAGRKVRALLTAFAIVIGVAMVSGTFILTDTMQKSFDGIFDKSYAQTDAVVEGKQVIENTNSGITIPQATLDKIRALPEVAAASGTVSPYEAHSADIIGADGKAVAQESMGGSFDPDNPQFSPVQLKKGKWAQGPEQVVIDAGTAKKEHYEIGDTVVISSGGRERDYELTGTVTFGGVDSLGFGSVAAWDVKTAQRLFNRPGSYDALAVGAKPGTTPAELVKAVAPVIPGNTEVKDASKQAEDDSEELDESMAIFRKFLLAFGGIALLVGAFVIFNTLSITVAQRTREFATLRTLGASRKQILRSVKTEGLVIGLLASVIGLVMGLGIAKGMIALFSALGVDLPDGGTVFAQRTVIVSLLLGTSITLLASILPARRATRVPPIAAVREGSTLPATRLSSRSGTTAVAVLLASLAALGVSVFSTGLSGPGLLLMGVGVLGLFVGIALVAPRLVKPLTRVVGWPARRIGGVAGELAGANSVRNPSRTASTAAALMIGLTLVTLVAVLGAGLRGSVEDAVSDQLRAGYVVDGDGGTSFKASEGEDLARVGGVTDVSHVRSEQAKVNEDETAVSGIDPATIAHFYRFKWAEGTDQTLAQLGTDGAIVRKKYADANELAVGSSFALQSPSGEKRTFVVRGIVDPPKMKQLLDDVVISREAFDGAFPDPKNKYTFIDADPSAAADLEATAKGFGDANLHTGAEYPKDSTKEMATLLTMLYVLLAFSVIVSLFGMVNTMVLSVFERTREIGMLRTIGMTRRQARRMIRHESVITALIGSALGLGLGLFLAGLVTQAASDGGIGFSVPVGTLVAFTLVAVIAGIGAAVMPARRASRLDVLNALQYE